MKHVLQYGDRPSGPPPKLPVLVKKPSRKQDKDLKGMSPAQLRREVMKLRNAFRKELSSTGNPRCWKTLLQALPEGKNIQPLKLPRKVFMGFCGRYYDRNQ